MPQLKVQHDPGGIHIAILGYQGYQGSLEEVKAPWQFQKSIGLLMLGLWGRYNFPMGIQPCSASYETTMRRAWLDLEMVDRLHLLLG